jgi:YegS/Rv2252/BmrU family lipid kinase
MTETLRRVALIYNPASGQVSARRAAAVRDAIAVFRDAGLYVESFETEGPGSGAVHARHCCAAGFDAVIACGGDGTVHEVLQPLVGTRVALGVLPLGTANALASNLNLIASPAQVARALLKATPVRVPVGRIHFHDAAGEPSSRYFVVAAGVGADALLMARLDSRLKRRLGYVLYLIEAFRIWATDPFPLFQVELSSNGNGSHSVEASQLLAVRVRSFGGVLRRLVPGATIHNNHLHLIAFQTRSRFEYLRFLLGVIAGRHTFNGTIRLHESDHVECRPANGFRHPLYVEADGEVLGHLPVQINVVPDALTLLVPEGAEP